MASSNVVSELVWHFAGYLRLPPVDEFTIKLIYDGGGGSAVGEDSDQGQGNHSAAPDADQLLPGHPYFSAVPPGEPLHWQFSPIARFHFPLHRNPSLPHAGPHPIPHLLPPLSGGDGGGGGGEFQITITYQGDGSTQELIDVQQINVMVTDNQAINDTNINAPSDVIAANDAHANHMLAVMEDRADDSIPAGIDPGPAVTTADLKAFVDAADAHPLATQANDAPYTFELGQYVNGSPVTDGSDPHQITNNLLQAASDATSQAYGGPPGLTPGDHFGESIEHISVGSNIEANDAQLTSLQGLSTSLAVLGNFYHTEEIVQTNVFAGMDQFTGNGTTSIAANTIENIADAQNEVPTLTAGGSGTTASGLHWTVDVLNGNLFDIHSLTQTNYLCNNNVVYQTTCTGESDIVAGGNTQANSAQFQNLSDNFDLIIVEGSCHQDDFIFQTNVLLDNNAIEFTGGGPTAQSATGGGNSMVNDATIVDTGNHNYQQFTADAMAVIQALENQSGTVDPNAVLSAFPDLFGNINILVVTGDLYDINCISQTNIMSNSNVVQLDGSSTAPAGATQSASTGNDVTVNAATIVDGGSVTSPYLQGSYYNDMILIQTNIIGNDPKVATQDPSKLVPELVAFTSATDSAPQDQSAPLISPTDPLHHNDGVAGVLH